MADTVTAVGTGMVVSCTINTFELFAPAPNRGIRTRDGNRRFHK